MSDTLAVCSLIVLSIIYIHARKVPPIKPVS